MKWQLGPYLHRLQAGPSVGCHCDSVCPDSLACSDQGCNGINDPNGKGFCTAGDNFGCSCNSDCPANQPACADCEGVDGTCTSGANAGCSCTLGISQGKRSLGSLTISKNIIKRSDPPRWGIRNAFYICGVWRGLRDEPTVSYTRNEVANAVRAGLQALFDDEPVRGSNGQDYPRRFYNTGGK